MNNYTKIIWALFLGCCLVGTASAFTLPPSETYLGYIGNIDLGRLNPVGLANPEIGTDWISASGNQDDDFTDNPVGDFDPAAAGYPYPRPTTHWFRFAMNTPGRLMDFIELGYWADQDPMTLSFFHDSAIYGNSAFVTVDRHDTHAFQITDPLDQIFASGVWWLKIEGYAYDNTEINYTVRLDKVAVPLPPAALLFISALAGFGVIGRKKVRCA